MIEQVYEDLTMLRDGNLHDAIKILFPKLTESEYLILITLMRENKGFKPRAISVLSTVPRTKVYGPLDELVGLNLIEESFIEPNFPDNFEDWGSKARGSWYRSHGLTPSDKKGYRLYKINKSAIIMRLEWVSNCIDTLHRSLLKSQGEKEC